MENSGADETRYFDSAHSTVTRIQDILTSAVDALAVCTPHHKEDALATRPPKDSLRSETRLQAPSTAAARETGPEAAIATPAPSAHDAHSPPAPAEAPPRADPPPIEPRLRGARAIVAKRPADSPAAAPQSSLPRPRPEAAPPSARPRPTSAAARPAADGAGPAYSHGLALQQTGRPGPDGPDNSDEASPRAPAPPHGAARAVSESLPSAALPGDAAADVDAAAADSLPAAFLAGHSGRRRPGRGGRPPPRRSARTPTKARSGPGRTARTWTCPIPPPPAAASATCWRRAVLP